MCCTGTLFNYVTLVPDDLPALEKYPQLKLKVRSEQATFDEPCVLHTGTGCGAYEDRPGTCSRYRCHVLIDVEKGKLTETAALALITEGRALVDDVKKKVRFEPGMPLAISMWEGPPEGLTPEGRRAWEQVSAHLGRHFLGTVKDEAPVSAPRSTRDSVLAAAKR